jgi:hypothetical protein
LKNFFKIAILVICTTPQLCHALDAAILANYNHQVTAQICKGNTNWLRCYGIDPLNCEGQSERIVDDCLQTHVFSTLTSVKSDAEVNTISQKLYSCIRSSFTKKFDAQKKDSPECQGLE